MFPSQKSLSVFDCVLHLGEAGWDMAGILMPQIWLSGILATEERPRVAIWMVDYLRAQSCSTDFIVLMLTQQSQNI